MYQWSLYLSGTDGFRVSAEKVRIYEKYGYFHLRKYPYCYIYNYYTTIEPLPPGRLYVPLYVLLKKL